MKSNILLENKNFPTAKENMLYDEHLLKKVQASSEKLAIFRFYEWQKPGLTFSQNKHLYPSLMHFDHSTRVSGGGIVFHSPGDCVFSISASLSHPFFPKKFKDKMGFVSTFLKELLQSLTIQPDSSFEEAMEKNLYFCNGYFNPYEIYVGGQKVVASAIRRHKNHFIVQGVVHCQSNWQWFSGIEASYYAFLTKGLEGELSYTDIYKAVSSKLCI